MISGGPARNSGEHSIPEEKVLEISVGMSVLMVDRCVAMFGKTCARVRKCHYHRRRAAVSLATTVLQ